MKAEKVKNTCILDNEANVASRGRASDAYFKSFESFVAIPRVMLLSCLQILPHFPVHLQCPLSASMYRCICATSIFELCSGLSRARVASYLDLFTPMTPTFNRHRYILYR